MLLQYLTRPLRRKRDNLLTIASIVLLIAACNIVQDFSGDSCMLLQSVEASFVPHANPCNLSSGTYAKEAAAKFTQLYYDVNATSRLGPSTISSGDQYFKKSLPTAPCAPNSIHLLNDGTLHIDARDSYCHTLTNQSAEDAFDAKGSLIVGVVAGQPSTAATMFEKLAFPETPSARHSRPSSTPTWQVACSSSESQVNESAPSLQTSAPVCWLGVQQPQQATTEGTNSTSHLQMVDQVIRNSDVVVYVVNALRVQDTRMIAKIARFLSHRSKRVVQKPQLWVVHDFADVVPAEASNRTQLIEEKVKSEIVDAFDAKRCTMESVNDTRCFTSTTSENNFPITHWVMESRNTTFGAQINQNTTHNMHQKLHQQSKSIRQRKVNIYRLLRSSMRRQQFLMTTPNNKHFHSDSPPQQTNQPGSSSHEESEAYWSSVRSLLAWSRRSGTLSSAAPPAVTGAASAHSHHHRLIPTSNVGLLRRENTITVSTRIAPPLSPAMEELQEPCSSLQTIFDRANHLAEVAMSDIDKLCVLNSLLSGRGIDGKLDFLTSPTKILDRLKKRPWTGFIVPAVVGFALNIIRVSHVKGRE